MLLGAGTHNPTAPLLCSQREFRWEVLSCESASEFERSACGARRSCKRGSFSLWPSAI